MDLGLTGRNCIVLGASRGIGRAIAQGLAAEGARLALCARDAATLDEFAATLRAAGTTVHVEPCDIGDPAALARFLADRGLVLDDDVGAAEYRARYFGAAARRMRGYEFYRIAVAYVPAAAPAAGAR
jgi:NAD(P)-dependent dehydrogenase (short-subunit alcohol dehydrogenase family)